VGDDRDVLPVTRNNGGAIEVKDGVFHSAEVEGFGEDDEVV
jgi:hypothetical protein